MTRQSHSSNFVKYIDEFSPFIAAISTSSATGNFLMRKHVIVILLLFLSNASLFADWPQFRGPNSNGIYQGKPIPTEFGPDTNELWSTSIPPGHSSPCVVGDSIFLTSVLIAEKKLEVICIDRKTGEIRWRNPIVVDRFEKGHPSFNPASSSPASDGKRVVAYFGSYGLICFDMAGKKLWDVKMPLTKSYAGNATSPAIFGNKVILYRGNQVDHFVLAVDKQSGKEIWKVDQEEPFHLELACTSCPILSGDKLILHTARSVQALDIESGKSIWVAKCATTATSTPVISDDSVIVAAWNKMGEPALRPTFPSFEKLISKNDKDGDKLISRDEFPIMMIFHRPDGAEAPENGASLRFEYSDKDKNGKITEGEWKVQLQNMADFRARYQTHGMLAIPLASQGLVDQEKVRTLEDQAIPEVPSPLFHNGLIYFVKNGGVLTCYDLKKNKRVYRMRTQGSGTHYASPIIANNKLYTIAGDGKVSVLSLGPNPKIVAVNQFNERIYASPAVSKGVLYIRTHAKIYAFGTKSF